MKKLGKVCGMLALAGILEVGSAVAQSTNVTFVSPPDASGLATGVTSIYTVCVGIALLALGIGAGIRYARKGLSGRG